MIAFARIPAPDVFAFAEALLPCCVCGVPGPHRTYPMEADGSAAVCGGCQSMLDRERRAVREELAQAGADASR